MVNPLFSTYTQGENRVTSTILAVAEQINNQLTEDILESLVDESDLSLVSFDNQVTGQNSVPDGAITASTTLWIETKTERDAVDEQQLREHLSALDEETTALQRLVALTPDADRPEEIDRIDDPRLVWANFDTLVGTVESVLNRDARQADSSEFIPTERETFLLRELIRFLYDESLVSGSEDRVLVVAARRAYGEYDDYGHYFCQPNRSFKPVSHLAFYKDSEIKPELPRVTGSIESVTLTESGVKEVDDLADNHRSELKEVVSEMEEDDSERYGKTQKVLFLEPETELDSSIPNDKTAEDSNQQVAFVYGHRYVSLADLLEEPTATTDLEE
jgi:hypothetical protein